jgi:hypothetical protein
MTIKEYYSKTSTGIEINGKIVAPRISQSGIALQWVVDESDGPSVIAHMADCGITDVRTIVRVGKMAIEAK